MTQPNPRRQPKYGFQRSDISSIELTIYPQEKDPVTLRQRKVTFAGRSKRDRQGSVVRASASANLGDPNGEWSVTVKPGTRRNENYFKTLQDGDWVDLTFSRDNRHYHVMRGLLKNINESTTTGGTGATTVTYTLSGHSFGSIWEDTSIFFNPQASENLTGVPVLRSFEGIENLVGSPPVAVTGFLINMLGELGNLNRSAWHLPQAMPNGGGQSFIDTVQIDTSGFPSQYKKGGANELVGIGLNYMTPEGTLWTLGKEWSDPIFNELFVDVLPTGTSYRAEDTRMTVVFREKPFPTLAQGRDSLWFHLPTYVIPEQQIKEQSVAKSGDERYNAFFVTPRFTQESQNSALTTWQGIWSQQDVKKFGIRRFDVASKFNDANANVDELTEQQRAKVRDWYCLNPYFLSGTISLATIRPDVRLGNRIVVPGRSEHHDRTYYVEAYAHDWEFGRGGRSQFTVTRGWEGNEDSLMNALSTVAATYTVTSQAEPGVDADFAFA